VPELIRIFMDLEGQPQASIEATEQLELRKKHRLPERKRATSLSDVIVWWDPTSAPMPGGGSYYTVGPSNPVLVPAGPAEPEALARFAGIMSEVFPGPPLRVEDIDRALRRIRGRD